MLCERCHEQEATVHLTETEASSGEMIEHHLCESCFGKTKTGQLFADHGSPSFTPQIKCKE